MRRLGILAAFALSLTACGGNSDPPVYRCNLASEYVCMQVSGAISASEAADIQNACETPTTSGGWGGTWAATGCATAGAVGRCGYTFFGAVETDFYYAPWTQSEAATDCSTHGGSFTPM
jgi:hypothetical protein